MSSGKEPRDTKETMILMLSFKAAETVDKKVTQLQLYQSGSDKSKATKHRLRQSAITDIMELNSHQIIYLVKYRY